MSQRHWIQHGKMMFVTTNTLHKHPTFLNGAHAREAIECLYRVQQLHPFFLYGFVIMPDHCHFLMKSMEGGDGISNVMRAYKSGLTFDIGIQKLWQPRFHIRYPKDIHAALQYIHMNPVKAGIVERASDYPWSSASRIWDIAPLERD